MAINRTIIKIFLASPGDLNVERIAAKRVVEEENLNHAHSQGYQFELVGWEDTVSQHGRAQEIINRDLDQCSFFVGLVWKRWGTPPGPEGSPFTSGFEEEHERSQIRFKETGKPNISLLFKNISDEDRKDVGPQLMKVLDFKKNFTEDYKGAYQTFESAREFEQKFRSILALFLRSQIEEDTEDNSGESSKSAASEERPNPDSASNEDTLFDQTAIEFVTEFVGRPREKQTFNFNPMEVARFRLLASTLQRSENDYSTIGPHDANLIYRGLRDKTLSSREKRGLVRSGLKFFSSETVPLWHWLQGLPISPSRELTIHTIAADEAVKKSAFAILQMLSADLRENILTNRDRLVELWLKNDNDTDVKIAALNYLGECGLNEDIASIEKYLDSSETTLSRAAIAAKILLLMRHSLNQALEFIALRVDFEIPISMVSLLLVNISAIQTDLLKKCLANRSTEFRLKVANELLERDEIDVATARTLANSPNARIRLIGAKVLKKKLPDFSLSDARAHIIKPKKTAAFPPQIPNGENDEAYNEYKHEWFCELNYDDLNTLLRDEVFYKSEIMFARYDRYFSKTREELVTNIDDDFKSYFSSKRQLQKDSASLLDQNLENFICENMLQSAIELLCTNGSKIDLNTIRKQLDKGKIKFADRILQFLEKHGNWEDVDRIIELNKRFKFSGRSFFSIQNNQHEYSASARALLKLGKSRLGDLIAVQMPPELQKSVFREMSNKAFVTFDDVQILEWLRSESDNVRKSVALKAVISLTKTRLNNILESYISENNRYFYNAVLWLDLGISTNGKTAKMVAQKELLNL